MGLALQLGVADFPACVKSTGNVAPVNTSLPLQFGTGNVGELIVGLAGLWSGNPAPTLTFKRLKNGVSYIAAATALNWTPTINDGGTVQLEVTANNGVGPPVVAL